MAAGGDVNHQVPDQVVVFEPFFGVEYGAEGVEESTCGDKDEQRGGSVAKEEWEEENHCPAHNQIYSQADGWNRAF